MDDGWAGRGAQRDAGAGQNKGAAAVGQPGLRGQDGGASIPGAARQSGERRLEEADSKYSL